MAVATRVRGACAIVRGERVATRVWSDALGNSTRVCLCVSGHGLLRPVYTPPCRAVVECVVVLSPLRAAGPGPVQGALWATPLACPFYCVACVDVCPSSEAALGPQAAFGGGACCRRRPRVPYGAALYYFRVKQCRVLAWCWGHVVLGARGAGGTWCWGHADAGRVAGGFGRCPAEAHVHVLVRLVDASHALRMHEAAFR